MDCSGSESYHRAMGCVTGPIRKIMVEQAVEELEDEAEEDVSLVHTIVSIVYVRTTECPAQTYVCRHKD